MPTFSADGYGPAFAELLTAAPPTELGPGEPNRAVYERLRGLTLEAAFAGQVITDRSMAECCLSGMWLLYNYLDESHTISQQIETTSGSYWHAIMHRREGDFSNSKYWLRRVGQHPIDEDLRSEANQMLQAAPGKPSWDGFRFVDLCEQAQRGQAALASTCKDVQQLEWRLLFDYCYRNAVR